MTSAPGTSGSAHQASNKDLLLAAHSAYEHSCSKEFWKEMERFFAPVTAEDSLLLKYEFDPCTKRNQAGTSTLADEVVAAGVATKNYSGAAIISTKQCNSSQGRSTFADQYDDFLILMGDTEHYSVLDLEFQKYFLDILSGGSSIPLDKSSHDAQWRALFPDKNLSQEPLSLSCKPALDDEVLLNTEIKRLQEEHYQHAGNVQKILGRIVAPVQCELQSKKRSLEESAMDQMVLQSYKKQHCASSSQSSNPPSPSALKEKGSAPNKKKGSAPNTRKHSAPNKEKHI